SLLALKPAANSTRRWLEPSTADSPFPSSSPSFWYQPFISSSPAGAEPKRLRKELAMNRQHNNPRLAAACVAILTTLSTATEAQRPSLPDAPASRLVSALAQDSSSSAPFAAAGPQVPTAPQDATQ